MERQGFGLVAFVYMPEHVHLVIVPSAREASVSALLGNVKRPTSWRIKRRMEAAGDEWLGLCSSGSGRAGARSGSGRKGAGMIGTLLRRRRCGM